VFQDLRSVFTSSFFLNIIFVSTLFLLIFISGISYRYTTALTDSSRLVVQSRKTATELGHLSSLLEEAQSRHAAFILTGDTSLIRPYLHAGVKTGPVLQSLKLLAGDNSQQIQHLDTLSRLIGHCLDLMARTLEWNTGLAADQARFKESLMLGVKEMERIRVKIKDMLDFDSMHLKVHQDIYGREISLSPLYILFVMLFSMLVFIFAYFRINKDLKLEKANNEKLLLANESMNHAEEIGEFSSWQWHLQTNAFDFSDNQYRLLGYRPFEFEPNLDKFLEFVHPEDRHKLKAARREMFSGPQNPLSVDFRIYRKDGSLRYFRSIAKLFTDGDRRPVVIGIHWDITHQHLNRLALEERNLELEQSNKELATFNHIASHDLQEPLRIIQTYVSRIIDSEQARISETSQGYFSRILAALSRMRALINDLLLYSRTTKTEKVFQLSDLNQIFENARQELAQVLEDKQAELSSDPLPEAKVIPFQIQQMFVNLIGNSLKFSRLGVKPRIHLSCSEVPSDPYREHHTGPVKKFYKLTLTDNGMGFEQQYARKIFDLFHRLHGRDEFTGSGIGLSICKKIAENHGGEITAEGRPGEGAAFTILLPH